MAEQDKPIRLTFVDVAPEDTEDLVRAFEALTGRRPTPEEIAELADED